MFWGNKKVYIVARVQFAEIINVSAYSVQLMNRGGLNIFSIISGQKDAEIFNMTNVYVILLLKTN